MFSIKKRIYTKDILLKSLEQFFDSDFKNCLRQFLFYFFAYLDSNFFTSKNMSSKLNHSIVAFSNGLFEVVEAGHLIFWDAPNAVPSRLWLFHFFNFFPSIHFTMISLFMKHFFLVAALWTVKSFFSLPYESRWCLDWEIFSDVLFPSNYMTKISINSVFTNFTSFTKMTCQVISHVLVFIIFIFLFYNSPIFMKFHKIKHQR